MLNNVWILVTGEQRCVALVYNREGSDLLYLSYLYKTVSILQPRLIILGLVFLILLICV